MNEEEIRERWKDMPKEQYCSYWMSAVIRHGHRNMDVCEDYSECDNTTHPDRYDGDVLSHSPKDIYTLLSIIDTLKKQLEEKNLLKN